MAQVFVDPEKLEEFVSRLVAFNVEVAGALRALRGALQATGETWRDQEYEKFREAFTRTERFLTELMREIENVHPKLREDAYYIREYQRINPPGG